MTERGMIFNAEMVRAVLDGSKTQTRRIMKSQPMPHPACEGDFWFRCNKTRSMIKVSDFTPRNGPLPDAHEYFSMCCPFGAVGDRLWVRETWARYNIDQNSHEMAYRATAPDDWPKEGRWRPSIHMPRWASRITLEITGVRVERLNDISEDDAKAEGAPTECCVIGDKHFLGFRSLWRSIYGADSWQANPWVWVIEFKRVEGQ
ncbi:morphogenetic protein [Pantoea dispersa]|uniref:morphogenetic protein n=1 Tax=Pantoea dispersa TaxID=59814 RepID=UPI00398A3501